MVLSGLGAESPKLVLSEYEQALLAGASTVPPFQLPPPGPTACLALSCPYPGPLSLCPSSLSEDPGEAVGPSKDTGLSLGLVPWPPLSSGAQTHPRLLAWVPYPSGVPSPSVDTPLQQ